MTEMSFFCTVVAESPFVFGLFHFIQRTRLCLIKKVVRETSINHNIYVINNFLFPCIQLRVFFFLLCLTTKYRALVVTCTYQIRLLMHKGLPTFVSILYFIG